MRFTLVLLITFFVGLTYGNDSRWKDCQDTFCKRLRGSPGSTKVSYSVDLASLKLKEKKVVGVLKPSVTNAVTLTLTISVLEDKICHISIDEEKAPTTPRYKAHDALVEGGKNFKIVEPKVSGNTGTATEASITYDDLKVTIYKSPMKFEFYKNDTLFSVVNANNRFVFETSGTETGVGLDISFKNVQRAYGLPEHADHLSLRTTVREEPYRHFNLDYGSYELESTQALYGAIGVLYAHGNKLSSGAFWLNAAQTWTDITNSPNQIDAYFMSESGVLDLFILPGPTLPQAVKQYSTLTGTASLPQYFTLGYHQSRYSYMNQDDVVDVVKNFDEKLLPIDVMWLDIDYTDEKKYFTWDPKRFSKPQELIDNLAKTNRKLVAIIDPHIKIDDNYFLHKEAKGKYYVRDSSGTKDFEGKCWPGMSSYLDFLNPKAREYYGNLYLTNHFENKNVHVWNDMNEPAVFEQPADEHSMPLDATHYGNRKHRDVHNIYGFYQTVGTKEGMMKRKDKVRPFILTRSHFAGTQRYAAVWTGDNVATWDYMKISFPMCLTEALAGISFCGADVGGFSGIPDDELYQRWYQAGAWLPFYRGHSAIDVPRREPYLYGDDVQGRIRAALHQRYIHIPMWYTLFYEHERAGEPVIRPITYHYPAESDAFDIEHEVLIGQNILAAPVMDKGVLHHKVYLPGGSGEVWYNIDDNYRPYNGTGYHLIPVNLNSMPVFYKAGSIISRKDAMKLTSIDTLKDPYTLYIVLNGNGYAEGKLYVDDGETFSYQDKKYYYVNFVFENNTLTAKALSNTTYADAAPITNLVIINPPHTIKQVKQINGTSAIDLNSSYNEKHDLLFVTNFTAKLQEGIDIKFTSSASILTLSIGAFIAVCISIVYNI
ncbi:neutral alpha-glucosidase C-like [Photinus pyralis]|uniref:neutral alpha-glucosidase C-like n=1 Tax=Photinus pyralis TaxID=7054 RepID=UPI0012674A07|nr:neutral alpha-glucosidase C-like [Photinus pyralis]